MQNDEVIWQVLRHKHCSFMTKITAGIFCRNPYNLTGVCNRSSCPLANSRYTTIRDHDGVFYLYIKTIERAHMPNKLWERVKLPRNYEQALAIIDKNLMYWPKFLVHKAKQRLTKMTQMRIRMRKLALKTREKIMTTPRKEIKREARREEKAERAALLEKNIEKELLERLNSSMYDSVINFQTEAFIKLLEKMEGKEVEIEEEIEEKHYVEGDYEEDDFEDFPTNGSEDDDRFIDDDRENRGCGIRDIDTNRNPRYDNESKIRPSNRSENRKPESDSSYRFFYDDDEQKPRFSPNRKVNNNKVQDVDGFLNLDVTGDEDDDEDDDGAAEVAVDRKRGRPDSKYALRKKEKDAKNKKGNVLVEVEHEDTGRRQKASARV